MPPFELRKIMMDLPKKLKMEQLEGLSANFQVSFTGEGASIWVVTLKDQTCHVYEGSIDNPDLTLRMDAEVGEKIFTGNLDPMRVYMLGKLRVSGDLSLGMKVSKLLSNIYPSA